MYSLYPTTSTRNTATPAVSRFDRYELERKMSARREALTPEEIAIAAPSVFAQSEHASRSDRYNYVDTRRILSGLQSEGWAPVWVCEQNVRNKSRDGFQKHMMRFRHADHLGRSLAISEAPEILLINSHDGTSSFQIHAALFRFICANGMVVADETFERLKVNHLNDADAVVNAALQVPVAIPGIVDRIDTMKRCEVAAPAQLALAEAAQIIRWDSIDAAPITAQQLLAPRRNDDAGNNLWSVFNRVQENVVKGGQRYLNRKNYTRGRVREVKGIDQNTSLNKALWHVADRLKQHLAGEISL